MQFSNRFASMIWAVLKPVLS